jgi:hypothetical protein
MIIARPDLDPSIRHPDNGAAQIFISKTDRLQHRPRRCSVGAIGDYAAARFQILSHLSLLTLVSEWTFN